MTSFYDIPPHPLSFEGSSPSGFFGHTSGDILTHSSGKKCRLDEALPDGEAFVTFEDGTYGEVKWNSLS